MIWESGDDKNWNLKERLDENLELRNETSCYVTPK